MIYQQVLAAVGISVDFSSYLVYFHGVFSGKTKPHIFTWLVWAIMNTTVFFAQIIKGGGAGSWITGSGGLLCLSVAVVALWYGEKNITKSDWLCLAAALSGIFGWVMTGNPLVAVVLASMTDVSAIIPTIRKAYHKPYEENVVGFSMALFTFVLQLFALESFNLTTALLPIVILINDSFLIATILIRRRYLRNVDFKPSSK